MNDLDALDLSSLAQFRASALLDDGASPAGMAGPVRAARLATALIELDASQPRRTIRAATIAELADSIRVHGVLEPISVRPHPEAPGRFIVNRGERRLRASRVAGLAEIPAFIDERLDPYAQAAENLHREDMSPFDLAHFIAVREHEGHTRSEIARRLGKPRSFITEAASLIDAPASVRDAFDQGRLGSDVRLLYRLAVALKARPAEIGPLLSGDRVLRRGALEALLDGSQQSAIAGGGSGDAGDGVGVRVPLASAGRTVLVVEHQGRRGSLRLKAQDRDVGEVCFADGHRTLIPLADLRPLCWATEE